MGEVEGFRRVMAERANVRYQQLPMSYRPFFLAASKSKTLKTSRADDVAARYFVYKLYDPGGTMTASWQPLKTLGETAATVARAVERGWVVLRDEGQGKHAALTDEGRMLARKALR